MLKVKICCIKNLEEAELAIQQGATAIGLVGPMPSGPGIISDKEIAAIVKGVAGRDIETFLLTSETDAEEIIAHHQRCGTSTIQLVDAIPQEEYAELRKGLPDTKLIQVIHVNDHWAIEEAVRVAPQVDAILLDSGEPNAEVKSLGGTGETHNWNTSRLIVEAVDVPVYLAGGLNAENVQAAVEQVNPYGVDLCSGVRTDDDLDAKRLEVFFGALGR